jgi:hypothetical protein
LILCKYREIMTCRLTKGRIDAVLYAEDSG